MRRRSQLAGAALTAIAALAMCPVAAADSLDPPIEFVQRAHLRDCGQLRQLPPPHDIPHTYLDCMADARAAGTGAELTATVTTIFDDTVTTYYRVYNSARPVEVFVENRDRGNNPGWEHYWCDMPASEFGFDPPSC